MKLRGQLYEHKERWILFAGLDGLSALLQFFPNLSSRHGRSVIGAEDREHLPVEYFRYM